jgi:hypothetical protein
MGSGIRYLLQHAKVYFAAFLKSILYPGDTKIGLQESLDLKTVPKVSPFSSINELTDPFFSLGSL